MYCIYTDGACSGNRRGANCLGGFGYVIVKERPEGAEVIEENGGKSNATTNNRMEMSGAIAGLTALKNHVKEPNKTKCKVITDSTYVCDNLNDYLKIWKSNGWLKSSGKPVVNKDLWIKIDQISSEFESVEFQWIKGHSTSLFNIRADEIAVSQIKKTNNTNC